MKFTNIAVGALAFGAAHGGLTPLQLAKKTEQQQIKTIKDAKVNGEVEGKVKLVGKDVNGTTKAISEVYGDGFVQRGDVFIPKNEMAKREHDPNDGPSAATRSFVNPSLIWDNYIEDGRIKIALKVDEASWYSDQREWRYMKSDLPKAIEDFRQKTGFMFGWHCDDESWFSQNIEIPGQSCFNHEHWMTLTARSNQGLGGCSSYLGRKGNMWDTSRGVGNGEQQISLQRGCAYTVTIQHEITHALGWTHEQNRADRDQYIAVDTRWISPAMVYNFKLEKGSDASGTPYDGRSIMQYHSHAFTTDWNHQTMISKTNVPVITYQETFDRNGAYQNRGLSGWDAYEMNWQYREKIMAHCAKQGKTWVFMNPTTGKPIKDKKLPASQIDTCVGATKARKKTCKDKPCKGRTVCVTTSKGVGYICKKLQDPCKNYPCLNNGECHADFNAGINPVPYTCQCKGNWAGKNCDVEVFCQRGSAQELMFDNGMKLTKVCKTYKNYNRKVMDITGRLDIKEIGNEAFSLFPNMQKLYLTRNKIHTLTGESFHGLDNLKILDLQHNDLPDLPYALLRKNRNLEVLNLANNNLQELPSDLMSGLRNLRTINVH